MVLQTIPVGVFECNCVIVGCESTRTAIVVDPGDEPDRVLLAIGAHAFTVTAIVHTHAHLDHVMGTSGIVAATGAPARIHRDEQTVWDDLPRVAADYGIQGPVVPALGEPLRHGEVLRCGTVTMTVLHTPGHTPGSCSFVVTGGDAYVAVTGDTLFRGTVGHGFRSLDRTRNDRLVRDSIRRRLLTLADDTRVIPGHGADTTIGRERRHFVLSSAGLDAAGA